mmetsp:Transcript_12738/g.28876  ORF Transcript_12738/g.28876 Transcript_12738/m.28876 type:complete len:201 (+) Transcript_12738:62-664(+)
MAGAYGASARREAATRLRDMPVILLSPPPMLPHSTPARASRRAPPAVQTPEKLASSTCCSTWTHDQQSPSQWEPDDRRGNSEILAANLGSRGLQRQSAGAVPEPWPRPMPGCLGHRRVTHGMDAGRAEARHLAASRCLARAVLRAISEAYYRAASEALRCWQQAAVVGLGDIPRGADIVVEQPRRPASPLELSSPAESIG